MTHRETAHAIAVGMGLGHHCRWDKIRDAIAVALAQIERETIERCAKMCHVEFERKRLAGETISGFPGLDRAKLVDDLANAIRALLPAPEPKETP